ncbi:MAG: NUDIX hydrolase [Chloroflexi bacterium]|nr:NUDIX hydrolase [Chloroflexota bacterium]MBI3761021.1 NUDIX hydrolase [Chloroflexota bacterium]
MWEVLSSRQLLDLSPWLTVTTQEVRLPNGTILSDYVVAPTREYSMVVALTSDERILLVKQYKHGLGHEAIELPAGYLDSPDEPPLECAKRELREETGCAADEWMPLGSFALDSNRGPTRCHFFLARGLRRVGDLDLDPSEALAPLSATPPEALALVQSGQIECIACAAAILLGLVQLGFLSGGG